MFEMKDIQAFSLRVTGATLNCEFEAWFMIGRLRKGGLHFEDLNSQINEELIKVT